MLIEVLKSKIHRAKITQTELDYVGSITIDEDLMDAANMIEGEKVLIVNNNNGERLETYAIPGPRGSGEITLNGAAARKVAPGDILILITYAIMDFEAAKSFKPALVADNGHALHVFILFYGGFQVFHQCFAGEAGGGHNFQHDAGLSVLGGLLFN